MRARDPRPKLTDTSGHAVGVVVKFLYGLQSNDVRGTCTRKAAQIEFLSADDHLQHLTDQALVGFGKFRERADELIEMFEGNLFGRRCGRPARCVAAKRIEYNWLARISKNPFPHGPQFFETILNRDGG